MQKLYYQFPGTWFGDCMPFGHGDKFYLYHQRDTRKPGPFGEPFGWDLATTSDFVHYEDKGVAIPRGTDEEQDQFIFAGSVFEAEGQYHIFYTGYNRDYPALGKPSQVLMHAYSDDLVTWHKTQDALTFTPQEGYDPDDWRDPWVIRDEENDQYLLILGARLQGPKTRQTGRTVKFTSKDLKNWKFEGDFWAPDLYTMHEMPDLFKIGDWWYHIVTEYSDRSKMVYRMSKSLEGPWIAPKDDAFDGRISQNPSLAKIGIPNLNVSVLDQLKPIDIEEYMEYLKLYDSPNDQTTITNGERGLKRKISSLRSFYTYYYKRQAIETNPVQLVDMPKIHDKAIIRLDAGETAALLDYIEHCGDQLTGQRKAYYEKTKLRDLAIVTLLLGTGIRVSECVGLDVEDIDFRNNGIRLIRKGGSEMVVYFGPEVEKALKDYLEARKAISPLEGHEHALFYSTQRKRIGVQAVENLVKKYARAITTTKKITPHKLRSTYGTTLYQETGDIYLVADVLGHKDVNTTKKHYAAMDDARRRKAATAIRLREDYED